MKNLQDANLYIKNNQEKVNSRYRGKYHACPPIGWMNDPNGFIFAFGKYHLFYQFHPYSTVWGPMHWGHFSSTDLVKWEDEPVALAPDMPYDKDGCFSGTSLVHDDKLYVMYTSVCGEYQTQALAVSADGVNFEKLGEVISTEQIPQGSSTVDFRDPKLFEEGGKFYCLIGSRTTEGVAQLLLFSSENLLNWNYVGVAYRENRSEFVCECPDFFRLNGVDILLTSPQNMKQDGINFQNQHSTIYLAGKLNLKTGAFEISSQGELDGGFDFYAAQTTKTPDGRIVMIAWQAMWDRTNITSIDGWANSMTLPRELSLKDGILLQAPVREIANYRRKHFQLQNQELNDKFALPDFGKTQEMIVTFDVEQTQKVGVKIFCGAEHETLIYYDKQLDCVVFDRSKMGKKIEHGNNEDNADLRYGKCSCSGDKVTMWLLLDVSSCEVFFADSVMTGNIYADENDKNCYLFTEGGTANIIELDLFELEFGGK